VTGARFSRASEKPEKQGARLLQTGQMESEWAKKIAIDAFCLLTRLA